MVVFHLAGAVSVAACAVVLHGCIQIINAVGNARYGHLNVCDAQAGCGDVQGQLILLVDEDGVRPGYVVYYTSSVLIATVLLVILTAADRQKDCIYADKEIKCFHAQPLLMLPDITDGQ